MKLVIYDLSLHYDTTDLLNDMTGETSDRSHTEIVKDEIQSRIRPIKQFFVKVEGVVVLQDPNPSFNSRQLISRDQMDYMYMYMQVVWGTQCVKTCSCMTKHF